MLASFVCMLCFTTVAMATAQQDAAMMRQAANAQIGAMNSNKTELVADKTVLANTITGLQALDTTGMPADMKTQFSAAISAAVGYLVSAQNLYDGEFVNNGNGSDVGNASYYMTLSDVDYGVSTDPNSDYFVQSNAEASTAKGFAATAATAFSNGINACSAGSSSAYFAQTLYNQWKGM